MIQINLAICLLALIPIIVAFVYGIAVAPRRRENMEQVILLSLSQNQNLNTRREKSTKPNDEREYLKSGLHRVAADFASQYTFRLYIPAGILTILYLVTLFLCMSRAAGPKSDGSWMLRLPACYLQLPPHDYILYAFIGAYAFNMGVLIRRTFLADVTEHVYWGAINRLIIATGIALAFYGIPKIPAPLFFIIAFMPQVLLTKLRKQFTSLLGDSSEEALDTPLQLVQGIDIWKEQRLQEEGIENVQNLATVDIFTIAVKTHYPIRTLIDWIDQAIFIQRFPKSLAMARQKGLPVSAIEFAWMAPTNEDQGEVAARAVAEALRLDPMIVILAMDSFLQDTYVDVLWTLWQNEEPNSNTPSLH